MIRSKQWPNMMGSNSSLIILELIDSFDIFPGQDKSWITRNFSTYSPVSEIPKWSATPKGERIKPGISYIISSGRRIAQPFFTSFDIALLRKVSCLDADLWLPYFLALMISNFQIFSSRCFKEKLQPCRSLFLKFST